MRLTGNLQNIKSRRDDANKDITIQVDRVEYITQKKDGKYWQPFDLDIELETPLVITGDCLARTANKHLPEGESEFNVYDKNGDEYELNPDKQLSVTTAYDFDAGLNIVTEVYYTITVSNEEFKKLKEERHKARRGKGKR
jgi:hypothetical protein